MWYSYWNNGRGGISVVTDELEITTTTNVNADLRENNSFDLLKRQESGIKKAIEIILLLLNNDFKKLESIENIEIIKK